MRVLRKCFGLACIGLLSYGLSSCTNEGMASVNPTMGLEVSADFLQLTDNGTELAGELSIVSGSTDIQLIWNTDSVCNLDVSQTCISCRNGQHTLPVKWQKKGGDGKFGPMGVAYKAGVKIIAGEYSKYVPLIWAEKVDTTKIMESISPVTRSVNDALPRVMQISMVPTTVNMNYENGGSMYVGLSDVPYVVFDLSEFTQDMNMDMSQIPTSITASQMLNFKWNSNGAPAFSFTAHILAISEGIIQSGAVRYEVTTPSEDYIEVAGVKWAKGNLFKSGNNYIFESSQTVVHNEPFGGAYFPWNSLDVTDGSENYGNYSYDKDPCGQVVPKGTWITPTINQFYSLVNSGYVYQSNGILFGGKVFLCGNGYREKSSMLQTGQDYAPYMSRSIWEENSPSTASHMRFSKIQVPQHYYHMKYHGILIRCVKK